MTDPIDEYCMQQLKEFDGKSVVCVTKEGLKFDESEEEKKIWEQCVEEFKPLTSKIKTILGDKVDKVVLSERVVDSPCVLVTGEFGWSANMERIMKAQALHNSNASSYMMSKKTMEINPHHIIIKSLKEQHTKDENSNTLKDLVNLIFESSLIASGFNIEEPATFVNRINNMIKLGLSLDETKDEEKDELKHKPEDEDEHQDEHEDEDEKSQMEEVD
jgi:molecular chaperone HtpG